MQTLKEIKDRLAAIHAQAVGIQEAADAQSRDLDDNETKIINSLLEEAKALRPKYDRLAQLAAIESAADLDAGTGRQTAPNIAAGPAPGAAAPGPGEAPGTGPVSGGVAQPLPRLGLAGFFGNARHADPHVYNTGVPAQIVTATPRIQQAPNWGWESYGHFARAVYCAAVPGQPFGVDRRLLFNQPTDPSSSTPGEDGGYAIPPDFRNFIASLLVGEGALLGLTDNYQTFSNEVTIPKDETQAWSTDGVRAYWTAEGAAITESKVKIAEQRVPAHKLAALLPVTQELLEDASTMDSYIRNRTPEAINWEVNDALINGDGTGKPLGMLQSAAKVAVTPEKPTVGGSFTGEDAVNMYSRIPARWRRNAVWLMNQELEPQLLTAFLHAKNVAGDENVSGQPMFIPPGGLPNAPDGSILGRPIVYTEACQGAGVEGDVIFCDPGRYMSVTKRQGIRFDLSIHFYFAWDVQSFRFIFRVGGKNWLDAPIASAKGSATYSNIVTLGARTSP